MVIIGGQLVVVSGSQWWSVGYINSGQLVVSGDQVVISGDQW